MKISTILFDLDGVLVDTCDLHYRALNKALKKTIDYEISDKDHKEIFNGLPTVVKLKKLGLFESEIKVVSELKQYYTEKEIMSSNDWFNDKSDLYSFLIDNKLNIGCVTNCSKTSTYLLLERSNQLQYMDCIITNNDVVRNKPYPDPYNQAIHKLGVDSNKCLCVEDSDKGVESAIASEARYLWRVQNTTEVTLDNFLNYLKTI